MVARMSNAALSKDLIFLILQYLNEEGYKEAAHKLEEESGFYFNMEYFEGLILGGNWDEAENYLSGFTFMDDNKHSTKIFFEIRKQNFLEALDKNERAKALDILMKDLKVFAPENEELYKEMTQLLTIENIREHDSLTKFGDAESSRKIVMAELKKIIAANPLFCDKLTFPSIKAQRLRRIINQGLNWQHINCANPTQNPTISTLFVDHVCRPSEDLLCPLSSDDSLLFSQMTSTLESFVAASLQPVPSTKTRSEIASESVSVDDSTNQDGSEDADDVSQELNSQVSNTETSAVTHPDRSVINMTSDFSKFQLKKNTVDSGIEMRKLEIPAKVARILAEGSCPTSMDFHPVQQTIILVGTNVGEIGLWDVVSGVKLLSRNFTVWNIGACSTKLMAALHKDACVSVNSIAWSPEGSVFGVAYSKHIVQVYSYLDANDVRQKLEIDAHVGGVNDIAFSSPGNKFFVITCGDDKTVKAWDLTTGIRTYSFEGHDAPVYSIISHCKESIPYLFSTSVDGKIKAWLYDHMGCRVDYDAPGLGRTTMAYSSDDKRLFSCGTAKSGESFLVEWSESEGAIKRMYRGLQSNSSSVVTFGTVKNKFLAAGHGHVIKLWDMDKEEPFAFFDVGGDLPENPRIRFNKDGTLLAIFANDNKIKICASDYDLESLQISENFSTDSSRVLSDTVLENKDSKSSDGVECESTGNSNEEVVEINEPSLRQTLWVPREKPNKILRLVYNNAGNTLLALMSDATHLVWKWQISDCNSSGKATTDIDPELWKPKNYTGSMINDLRGTNGKETLPCFALSNNDSYLMSSSGGKISLFNMITFKTMMSLMSPPPATTSLAFLPQDNNIVAIGRDDATIIIYHVRYAKVIGKLVGHFKRVSSLAFSKDLNMLVSSGADAQIFVWNVEGWAKHKSRFMQVLDQKQQPGRISDTHIQFYQDQAHFLAVHETSLAIYEAKSLDCLKQWVAGDTLPITSATLSCDSQMIYAAFMDGTVSIFGASNLELQARIVASAYHPPCLMLPDEYAMAIAAHPHKPNQFAMGLTTGWVLVFEPVLSKWTELPSNPNRLAVARTPPSTRVGLS